MHECRYFDKRIVEYVDVTADKIEVEFNLVIDRWINRSNHPFTNVSDWGIHASKTSFAIYIYSSIITETLNKSMTFQYLE